MESGRGPISSENKDRCPKIDSPVLHTIDFSLTTILLVAGMWLSVRLYKSLRWNQPVLFGWSCEKTAKGIKNENIEHSGHEISEGIQESIHVEPERFLTQENKKKLGLLTQDKHTQTHPSFLRKNRTTKGRMDKNSDVYSLAKSTAITATDSLVYDYVTSKSVVREENVPDERGRMIRKSPISRTSSNLVSSAKEKSLKSRARERPMMPTPTQSKIQSSLEMADDIKIEEAVYMNKENFCMNRQSDNNIYVDPSLLNLKTEAVDPKLAVENASAVTDEKSKSKESIAEIESDTDSDSSKEEVGQNVEFWEYVNNLKKLNHIYINRSHSQCPNPSENPKLKSKKRFSSERKTSKVSPGIGKLLNIQKRSGSLPANCIISNSQAVCDVDPHGRDTYLELTDVVPKSSEKTEQISNEKDTTISLKISDETSLSMKLSDDKPEHI